MKPINYLFLCLSLLLPTLALAHDEEVKDPSEWDIALRLGFNYNSGNVDTNLIDFGARAHREVGDDIYHIEGGHRTGENDGIDNIDDSFLRGEYNHLISDRWYLGFGAGWVRDDIALVDYRVTIEPKLGYYFAKDDDFSLAFEVGPGYIFEEVNGIEDDYFAPFIGDRLDWAISENSSFFQQARFYFDLDNSDNWLLNSTAGIETNIAGPYSLITGVQFDYDNLPAAGRQKDDLQIITALSLSL